MNIFSKNYIKIDHPRFIIDLMYAKKENITREDIYHKVGFENEAFTHVELWNKLKNIIPYLEETDQYLKVLDAYRPPLAHELMKKIIPTSNFFADTAEKSPHCRAIAIDVCLCDKNKIELKYPTTVDAYTPSFAKQVQNNDMKKFEEELKKATHSFEDESYKKEIENRKNLKKIMEDAGLRSLEHEWWHYNLVDRQEYQKYPIVNYQNNKSDS